MSGYEDLSRLVTFRPLERPLVGAGTRVSQFKASWSATVTLLARELGALRASGCVLEYDFREQDLRLDGLPRASASARSPGIVLSFVAERVPGRPQLRYEVATFRDWQDNVRAVALGLSALRAVDRYGVTRRGEQYAGWVAIEAPGAAQQRRGEAIIAEHGGDVRGALAATHPDHGGDEDDFKAVCTAAEAARLMAARH